VHNIYEVAERSYEDTHTECARISLWRRCLTVDQLSMQLKVLRNCEKKCKSAGKPYSKTLTQTLNKAGMESTTGRSWLLSIDWKSNSNDDKAWFSCWTSTIYEADWSLLFSLPFLPNMRFITQSSLSCIKAFLVNNINVIHLLPYGKPCLPVGW